GGQHTRVPPSITKPTAPGHRGPVARCDVVGARDLQKIQPQARARNIPPASHNVLPDLGSPMQRTFSSTCQPQGPGHWSLLVAGTGSPDPSEESAFVREYPLPGTPLQVAEAEEPASPLETAPHDRSHHGSHQAVDHENGRQGVYNQAPPQRLR